MYGGGQQNKPSQFPQRARAARPKAAMPAKALTPTMEPADLEEVAAGAEELVDEPEAAAEWLEAAADLLEAGVVAVVAAAEPEDAPVAAAVVADPVGRPLNVTPTAAQSASAAAIAAWRSEPVQAVSMQAAVLSTKAVLLQRQALSVAEQPPRSADAIHVPAQAGMFWRL